MAGCSLFGQQDALRQRPIDLLEERREMWNTQNISSYEFTINGWDGDQNYGPVRIMVRDGAVDTAVVEGAHGLASYPTFADIFDYMRQSLERNPDRSTIDFNDEIGYPLQYNFDFDRGSVGDERSLTVTRFDTLANGS